MSYVIDIAKDADKIIKKWKKSNPQLFKNIRSSFTNWRIIREQEQDIQNRL